ncbi:DNA-binding SARP family transcriptional activator [Saccharomonospora amisosensis]|uniref:DNA-binding SARP family transcriptional activator n=1 Tax=Saccharomonospora amisosensis TaxID=1128677 RepID=A0A7X5UKT2_9PSEU|nr:BTAD domain-containing putative transcriptional regulator [Saccharomonospora amisosensis]NIJ09795.1 DNA-binding SARP family transcriptional activator [Saccharomonospora amisosensis]
MTPLAGRVWIVRTARLAGRVVRALVAATLLAALVAGLPTALIHGVGWPLPGHLPGLEEIAAVLLAPMSSSFLLDTLACLAWLLWLVFVRDVAACVLDVIRKARWPDPRGQGGPVRRVAAVLIGALLVAVLGRTAIAALANLPGPARPVGHTSVVADAPAGMTPAAGGHTSIEPPHSPVEPGVERVRPPRHGVHDSLWRIAQRRLGDGDRWPQIWALNQGSTQPGGRVMTNPNLIHPGDLIRLPASGPPRAPAPPPGPTTPTPPSSHPAPSAPPSEPTAPAPATTPAAESAAAEPAAGAVTWGSGEVFVSLGLAAAVSALLLRARRRHHARYRPGSGRRDDDLPTTPVVYQLRLAHLHAQHHNDDPEPDTQTDHTPGEPAAREHPHDPVQSTLAGRTRPVPADPPSVGPQPSAPVVDIALDTSTHHADNATTNTAAGGTAVVALDLARVHGLGLLGPGGHAAARALLLTLLTTAVSAGEPVPSVLVPAGDLARLLGVPVPTTHLPDTLTVVADLETALATLDTHTPVPQQPTVLVASPPHEPHQQARLQQLLDNGAQHGLTALLLGQWRPGVTAYVTAGGRITATNPGLGEPLRGTRAFTLPETATGELLSFLRTTQPPVHHRTANHDAAPDTAQPSNAESGPDRLEITTNPPAPTPPAADADEHTHEPPPPVAADTNAVTPVPLVLTVFGAPALRWRPNPTQPDDALQDLSPALSNRLLELLVFLAVHPSGVSRHRIIDALWPEQPPRNPASVLRTILSRIRRALDTATGGAVRELVLAEHGHYQLDPAVIEVDYWNFAAAVTRRRATTTPEQRTHACQAIVARYGGPIANGLDAEWLTTARETTRRDALDAVAALARAQVETNPADTLDLLETARGFDPHNELLYRDIMRLQHVLGHHHAISRTLTLLQTHLAEIDTTPTTDTINLAQHLRARHTGISVEASTQSPAT